MDISSQHWRLEAVQKNSKRAQISVSPADLKVNPLLDFIIKAVGFEV
jgi:hypothetical protein